ncbi:MAG: glycosyl hydrolase, partial [Gemmatimonadota bacterium]
RDVSVWLNNYDGYAVGDVPYRFQWTFPIVFSPHDRNTLYTAAQYLFRSHDGGQSWEKISPDLTRHDPKTMGPVGGIVSLDMTGTEWYATIFAFAESPVKAGVLWAGSDDGMVHVSTDDGATWQDVTPKKLPGFARISIIEPSHHDAGTAYIAANRYQQDDFHPYLYRTTDYGRHWTRIDDGIPVGAYTRTIREDPETPGLLFAGTETGVYVSLDDGGHWQPLQLNLPKSSVRDLAIRDGDLVAATHGRSFWVLDDIQPLRDWAATRGQQVHLFQPRAPVRFAGYGGGYAPRTAGQNPPNGVIVDWYLASRADSVVTLEFLDSAGTVIRSFTSEEQKPSRPEFRNATAAAMRDARLEAREQARIAGLADSASFAVPDSIVPKRAGLNRFVWDLSYPDANRVPGIIDDYGTRAGPVVPPGTYTARLTVGGKAYTRTFQVKEDPRVDVSDAQLAAQFDLAMKVRQAIDTIGASIKRIDKLESQLDTWKSAVAGKPFAARVDSAAGVVRDSLESVRAALVCVHCHADESSLNYPIQLYNKLISFNMMVQSAHAQPTDAETKVWADLKGKLDTQLARLDGVESGPVAALNGLLDSLGVQRIGGQ